MRLVLMLLVLANLGVFAWSQWYSEVAGNRMPQGRVDAGHGERLVLVSERGETPSDSTGLAHTAPGPAHQDADSPEGKPEVAPQAVCATVGPFDQLDLARLAQQRLAELGKGARIRESGGQIRSGFWVHLPPFASRNAAKQVEAELRERGVRDLFIVTESEQRNAISLGLFTTPDRADQRAAEIGRLGFTPRVSERFRDATVYWVDFRESDDEPLEPESIGVAAAGDTVPEKQQVPCDRIAIEGGGA